MTGSAGTSNEYAGSTPCLMWTKTFLRLPSAPTTTVSSSGTDPPCVHDASLPIFSGWLGGGVPSNVTRPEIGAGGGGIDFLAAARGGGRGRSGAAGGGDGRDDDERRQTEV